MFTLDTGGEEVVSSLEQLWSGPEPEINLFIHGYGSLEEKKARITRARILAAWPRGRVYLLRWNSGRWWEPLQEATKRPPMKRPLPSLFDLAVKQALHFKHYEAASDRVGQELLEQLSQLPNVHDLEINLFGHSLGARVICESLRCDWKGYNLRNVIFLAGAADVERVDWLACTAQLRGKLYNAYSRADRLLLLTPDLTKRVGRNPIPCGGALRGKVVNRHFASFLHGDYFRKLDKVLRRLFPEVKPIWPFDVETAQEIRKLTGMKPPRGRSTR